VGVVPTEMGKGMVGTVPVGVGCDGCCASEALAQVLSVLRYDAMRFYIQYNAISYPSRG